MRNKIGLALLVVPTLLVAMDMTALFLALPRLCADLGASGTQQLWISDSYGFLVAGFVITMGTLGDRIGRRRLLLTGGAAFAVISVVAAYATDPLMLIVARALLGIAGATLMPSTLALITTMFPGDRERGRAIAVWATCQFAGGALGPVLAGALLAHFWWGSVFLVAVPAMVLLLAVGPLVLPEYRTPAPGRIDLPSVALSLSSMLLLVYGLKQLAVADTRSVVAPLLALAVGATLGVVFVRRQLTLPTPLLDLRLFRNRQFTAVLVALVFAGVAMAGTGLEVTQYLQSVLGHSPLTSALLFAPMGLGVAIGTFTAPALTRWVTPTTAIAGGLAVSALGSLALAGTAVVPGIFVLALGTGPLFALGTSLVVGSVPAERAGSAAAMSETSNYVGGSVGIAGLGMVAAAVYRSRMSTVAGPAGQTLAGAIAAGPASAVHAAKAAFTAGLTVTGVIATVIFAGLAVIVAVRRPARVPVDARQAAPAALR